MIFIALIYSAFTLLLKTLTRRTVLNYYLVIHNHRLLIVYEDTKNHIMDFLITTNITGEITSIKEFFIYQIGETLER